MKIQEFFEKNYGDKVKNPFKQINSAYRSIDINGLIELFKGLNIRMSKKTEQNFGPNIIYKAWEEDNEKFLSDTGITNMVYNLLNQSVIGGIQSASGDDWPSSEERDKLKKRLDIFVNNIKKRKFPKGFICDTDGNLKLNDTLDKYYSEEVKKFIGSEDDTPQDEEEGQDQSPSDGNSSEFVSFLRSLQLLEHSIKKYTRLYMESNKDITTLLEGAFTEQQIGEIFSKEENLTKFLDLGTPEQINYVINKIMYDLPDSQIKSRLDMILSFKNDSEDTFVNRLKGLMRLQGVTLNDEQLKKLYTAIKLPTPTDIPSGLESFGKPGGLGTSTQSANQAQPPVSQPAPAVAPTAAQSAEPPTQTPGIDPTDKELEIYRRTYNANYNEHSPQDRANLEQIRKNTYSTEGDMDDPQVYRAQKRLQSLKPLENRFVRTGFNQFRPAVQADAEAGTPLFMQNPNPVYREFNPYVQVDRYEAKRNKQPAPDLSKNRVNPTGARIERDGSIRRKSKLGGAAGSLSNFLGDVGNTLKGR